MSIKANFVGETFYFLVTVVVRISNRFKYIYVPFR